MNKIAATVSLIIILLQINPDRSNAQSVELIGGNVINGALTGSILGVATMGLYNTSDFSPFRIGLGAGILYGTGIAVYDVATVPRGQMFFISGLLNDGENSSIIVLLDTVYGAAVGVALGSAFALIGDRQITDALQYGASAGAWVGFGFGLIDAFVLAERNRDFVTSSFMNQDSMISIQNNELNLKIIQPGFHTFTDFTSHSPGLKIEAVLHLFTINRRF